MQKENPYDSSRNEQVYKNRCYIHDEFNKCQAVLDIECATMIAFSRWHLLNGTAAGTCLDS